MSYSGSGGICNFLNYIPGQGQEKLLILNGKKHRLAINNIDFILGRKVLIRA